MSLILPYRFKRSSGGGGALVHNQTFSIIASGFGTKSKGAPNAIDYGAAGVGNLDSTWDIAAPNYGGNPDGGDPQYFTKNVALPHSNGGTSSGVPHANTSIAVSGVGSGTGGPPSTDVYIAKFLTWSGAVEYSYWHSYHRVANNWQFGIGSPNDDNFKWYGIAEGHGGIYASSGANMYLCYQTSPDGMHDNTTEPLLQTLNEDLGFVAPFGSGIYTWGNHDPSTGNAKNFAKGWVKQEIFNCWSPSAGVGYIREWHNNVDIWNSIYTSATDSLSASTHWGDSNLRSEGIGGYQRDSHSLNRRYWCDVIFDRDANPGRWYVSNSNSWSLGSGILAEPQPWVFWSTTRCDMTFKKGGLSSGPGFAFYVNERDGNQGPFAVTIA